MRGTSGDIGRTTVRPATRFASSTSNTPARSIFRRARGDIRRAGVEPWPRVWHSMRASCESDLAQSFPLAVVTKWLGNTPSVALRHYVDPTEAAYTQAASWVPGGGAKSGAPAAHFPAQQ